jgi:hypothetical protein
VTGSRADYYWHQDAFTFNKTVFDQTKSYWTAKEITIQMAANARYARVTTSNATNPTFKLSLLGEEFGFGESAAYLFFFSDQKGNELKGEARRKLVEYFFGECSAPQIKCAPGWERKALTNLR